MDPDSQPNYTGSPSIAVALVALPSPACLAADTCHLEYCLSQSQLVGGLIPSCAWRHQLPTTYTLSGGNGSNTVYAEYRIVYNNTATPSSPATASITLNTVGPSVALNSPAGLSQSGATQKQLLNASSVQSVTYIAASSTGETLAATVNACGAENDLCIQLTPSPFSVPATPPQVWVWPGYSPAAPPNGYLQITVTDLAGNQTETAVPSAPAITQFSPGSLALTCGPQGQAG